MARLARFLARRMTQVGTRLNRGAEPVVPRALLEAEQNRGKVLEEVVADLRRRLDAEAEERRRLTMVLADMRTAAPASRRAWWRWGRQ